MSANISNEPAADLTRYTGDDLKRLDRIERKLDEMNLALSGNPQIGFAGIVPRLETMERTVALISIERADEKSKRTGAITTISFLGGIAGAAGAMATWIIQNITNKT